MVRAVTRHGTPLPAANKSGSNTETGEYLAHAFSDIELLVAVDVIESAISEGRRHVDLGALKRVLAKLTAAHNWKKRTAG
jgi:hypothetical protein